MKAGDKPTLAELIDPEPNSNDVNRANYGVESYSVARDLAAHRVAAARATVEAFIELVSEEIEWLVPREAAGASMALCRAGNRARALAAHGEKEKKPEVPDGNE